MSHPTAGTRTGRLSGKTVLITGAARGQGRSHALVAAAEGADVVLVDICADVPTVPYPLGTPEGLAETAAAVERAGSRAIAVTADVRDQTALRDVAALGVERFGRIDVVVANAGVCPLGPDVDVAVFNDVIEINFNGVVNTVSATLPYLTHGASIVATGSLVVYSPAFTDHPTVGPGNVAYRLSKTFVASYVHDLARSLAPSGIRVNAVHPTTCNTAMVDNPSTYKTVRPDLVSTAAES